MTTLAEKLQADPEAFAGAWGDLAAALRLTPAELAAITLAVAGKPPAQARQAMARLLTHAAPAAQERPAPTPDLRPTPQRQPAPQYRPPRSRPKYAGGFRLG
jgi:hypothetical protein